MLGIIFLGMIAAVAIPQVVMARERARDVAAKDELSRVMVAEEAHFVERGTYTGSLSELGFEDVPSVTTTIAWGDATGYAICSQHAESAYGWRVDSSSGVIEQAWGGC